MLAADSIIADRYRIQQKLGSGGMAVVYLADDEVGGGQVALKAVHADERGRFVAGAVTGFRYEASMLRGLSHPNIARVYDFIELDQHLLMVMEFVDGRTMVEVLHDEGTQEEVTVLDWAAQLCRVFDYLHQQQPPIIFRDLKPGNIMVAHDGQLKLIDFGIAKYFDETLRRSTQTTARGMLSPGYAAVEQYIGGTDARSDVYALGATLFTALTADIPTESLAVATGKATAASVRDTRPDVSEELVALIDDMMQMDRNKRPQDMREVMARLGVEAPPRIRPSPPPARPVSAPRVAREIDPPTERYDVPWTPSPATE